MKTSAILALESNLDDLQTRLTHLKENKYHFEAQVKGFIRRIEEHEIAIVEVIEALKKLES